MDEVSAEDITQAEMRRWLTRLEKSMVDGFKHVDDRLDRVSREVQTAAFVPITLYQSERDGIKVDVEKLGDRLDRRVDGVDKRIDNMRTLLLASIGLMLTATGIIVSLVKAFG